MTQREHAGHIGGLLVLRYANRADCTHDMTSFLDVQQHAAHTSVGRGTATCRHSTSTT